MSGAPRRGILDGLRIVEVSAFVAAPLGGATLAALGADVVRVDPIGGGIDIHRWPVHGDESLYWSGLNQGKRSVTIDTRSAAGRDLVVRLIGHAGICLTNLPVAEWMSYERLAAARPDVIMAVITGDFDGTTAVDYTVNAAVGLPWITGPQGWSGPVNHVLPAWDALTGYLISTGILAAELERSRSGRGDLVRLSLSDVALAIIGHLGLIAEAQLDPEPRGRLGNDLFGSFARDFVTADERHVIIVALTPRQWGSLIDATGLRAEIAALESRLGVDLNDEGERFRARLEICALLEPWVARQTLDEVRRSFSGRGVLWGPYQTVKELVDEDPRASTRNPLFRDLTERGTTRRVAGSPLTFVNAEPIAPRPGPRIGADTAEVLSSWLGLSPADLAGLSAGGVIASSTR
jgi:2-methylfumaryl-CoA isomerase